MRAALPALLRELIFGAPGAAGGETVFMIGASSGRASSSAKLKGIQNEPATRR
jgi:hypothetical protein